MTKPMSYTPPALWPPSTTPENVPAQVVEFPATKTVRIYHASGNVTHDNVRRCVQRYTKRGWAVTYTQQASDLRRAA
jgi:hypothetical protein